MKILKQAVNVNRPAEEVFVFCIDPKNTPKWIDSIVTEQTNEWPVKLGTIYRNQRKDGNWSEYEVTAFEASKLLVLSKKDEDFYVKYSFRPIGKTATKLEYELPDNGKIDESFIRTALKNLKRAVETS